MGRLRRCWQWGWSTHWVTAVIMFVWWTVSDFHDVVCFPPSSWSFLTFVTLRWWQRFRDESFAANPIFIGALLSKTLACHVVRCSVCQSCLWSWVRHVYSFCFWVTSSAFEVSGGFSRCIPTGLTFPYSQFGLLPGPQNRALIFPGFGWGISKEMRRLLQALEKERERKAVRSQIHLTLHSCCPLALCVVLIGHLSCVFILVRLCYLVAKVYYLKWWAEKIFLLMPLLVEGVAMA